MSLIRRDPLINDEKQRVCVERAKQKETAKQQIERECLEWGRGLRAP